MELVYTDSSHEPQGIIRDFTLDMAIGEDENDFELSVAAIPEVTYSYRTVEDEAEGYEVEVMPEVGGTLSALGIDGHAEVVGGRVDVVQGKNLFDAENLVSGVINTSGAERKGYYVPVTEGVTYTASCAAYPGVDLYSAWTTGIGVKPFGESGNVALTSSKSYPFSKTMTAPAGAKYLAFWMTASRKAVGIQFERGSVATPYTPYGTLTVESVGVNGSSRSSISLGSHVLASLPNGIKDELRVEGGKAAITKRVGVVDLGTLSWSYNSTYSYFYTGDVIETPYNSSPFICEKYEFGGNNQSGSAMGSARDNTVWKRTQDASTGIAKRIFVKDSGYSTNANFKTAMDGVLLYYELADPYEVELQDVDMPEYFKGYTLMHVDAALRAYMRARYVFRLSVETFKEVARFDAGSYVYEFGTDRGGVIDTVEYDGTGKVPLFKYSGRTWSGIMENSVTRPDAGASHLVLNGDLNACISTLISRAGLTDVFAASEVPCGVSAANYQLPRYINLYEALTRLCRDHGMRLRIAKGRDIAIVDAVKRGEWLDGSMSDLTVSMRLKSTERPCNHLVLLGEGELAQRLVRDVYADAYGNVSTTQSLFGIDEVAEVYETSNEGDPAKLVEDGLKKLSEMQGEYDLAMTLPDGAGYELGDIVQGVAVEAGFKATAEVVKQVIEVDDDGVCKVGYKVGTPTLAPLM